MTYAVDIVSLGPRPYYLVDQMKPSDLKDKLGKNYWKVFVYLLECQIMYNLLL